VGLLYLTHYQPPLTPHFSSFPGDESTQSCKKLEKQHYNVNGDYGALLKSTDSTHPSQRDDISRPDYM